MESERGRIASLRFVNRWFYLTARLLFARPLQLLFRLEIVNRDAVPRTGPVFVLPNHVTLFDPIWLYASLRRPVYLVATEELFRSRFLRVLIRWFGAFPKRKATRDMHTVKSMFAVLRSGGIVGVYPEGVRTWDGTNAPIIPTIARVIRKFRVPVVTCRFDGGYFAWPRWASHWRRVPVRIVFEPLYPPEAFPATDEEMVRQITERIRIRDYELPGARMSGSFHGLSEGISRILYRCPQCGSLESLRPTNPPRRNRFECSSCSSSWKLDVRCHITPVDKSGRAVGVGIPLPSMYKSMREMPLAPVRSGLVELEPGESLYLISSPHLVLRERKFPHFRPFAFGRLFLTSQRLMVQGGRGLRLSVPVDKLESLSIEPGNKLHFVHAGRLYRVVFRNTSALKWADFIERIVGRRLTAMA